MKLIKCRNILATGLLAIISWSSPAVYALDDVLKTPSAETRLADQRLLIDVAQAGSRYVAVGARGHIIYSDNLGQTWSQASVPVSVLLTAVDFVDSKNGWAVGHGGVVLHTSDGGETWALQFDGNQANRMNVVLATEDVKRMEQKVAEVTDEDEKMDLEDQLDEVRFQLEDAQADAKVGASKPFLDVYFQDKNTGYVIGAYGFFFKTGDGGKTWENYSDRIDNVDRFHLNAITALENGTLFIAGEAGILYRSTDGGQTWESLDSPYEGSFFGISPTGKEGRVIVFGLRGNLYRSDDSGDSWEKIDVGTENSLMSAQVGKNGRLVIVGTSGTVVTSHDYGDSFTVKVREDRLGINAAIFTDSGRMVLAGEKGIELAGLDGRKL